MNLYSFLELCDPNMKVAITNENGVGGASYVAWPEHGWTVKSALDELGCFGGYHVCHVSIEGDMLYIEADENPWDYGSYWMGEWEPGEMKGYEVRITGKAHAVESCEEDAEWQVRQMVEDGEINFKFEVVEKEGVIWR